MAWLSWLRWKRKDDQDYETVLSQLETRIKARESALLSIRLRERRANALFITYGTGLWLVYVLLWWLGLFGGRKSTDDSSQKILAALPVLGGPVLIVFTRRILRYWYTTKQDKEEATLRTLKKEQRDKVEELKRKTGYYSTRNLLEKYDEVIKKNAEARGLNQPTPNSKGAHKPQQPPSTPQRGLIPGPNTPFATPGGPQKQLPNQPVPFPLLPPAPSTPASRTVFDKLADALLGVSGDEGTPNSKYALICGKCFAHNGLVAKEEYDTIQYQCPRCGFFNPRRKPLIRTGSDSHRRVQSMVSPSTMRPAHDSDDGREEVPSTDKPSVDENEEEEEDDEKEDEEQQPVLLKDQVNEGPVRQRKAAKPSAVVDKMEVDS